MVFDIPAAQTTNVRVCYQHAPARRGIHRPNHGWVQSQENILPCGEHAVRCDVFFSRKLKFVLSSSHPTAVSEAAKTIPRRALREDRDPVKATFWGSASDVFTRLILVFAILLRLLVVLATLIACRGVRSSHLRPSARDQHKCSAGVLCRDPPVCYRVQGDSVAKRQLCACCCAVV